MAIYYYLKSETKTGVASKKAGEAFWQKAVISRKRLRLIPLFFLSFGLGLLSWLAWPFLEWRAIYAPRFTDTEIIRPAPLLKGVAEKKGEVAGEGIENPIIQKWFPQAPQQSFPASSVRNYALSIPKLKIVGAQVIVGAEDLMESLIHYGPAVLPGENGAAVVFGHSVLPHFFNPKSYQTIFSTIHTLEEGDEILVDIDGVEYRYKVFGLEVIDPGDISFLEQRNDNSYLYLITCTPPGTYWKRLIVKASLEHL